MPNSKPVTPPTPRHINRPLVQQDAKPDPRAETKPLTVALMGCVLEILDEKKVTITQFSKDIGVSQPVASEYLRGFRNSPGAECTLRIVQWANKRDSKRLKAVLALEKTTSQN